MNHQASQDDLFGRWNWIWSTGGIAGQTLTPATEGYTQALHLERSQAYTLFRADTVLSAGTFTLAAEDTLRIIRYERDTGQAGSINRCICRIRIP